MKCIEGRHDDFLVTSDGRLIGSASRQYFDTFLQSIKGLLQYRVIQEKKDKIKIQFVIRRDLRLDKDVLAKIQTQLQGILGKGMEFEFQQLDELNRETSGKMRKFINLTR